MISYSAFGHSPVVDAEKNIRLVSSLLKHAEVVVKREVIDRGGLKTSLHKVLLKMVVILRRLEAYRNRISSRTAIARHVDDSVFNATVEDDIAVAVLRRVGAYHFHCLSLLADGIVAVEDFPVGSISLAHGRDLRFGT